MNELSCYRACITNCTAVQSRLYSCLWYIYSLSSTSWSSPALSHTPKSPSNLSPSSRYSADSDWWWALSLSPPLELSFSLWRFMPSSMFVEVSWSSMGYSILWRYWCDINPAEMNINHAKNNNCYTGFESSSFLSQGRVKDKKGWEETRNFGEHYLAKGSQSLEYRPPPAFVWSREWSSVRLPMYASLEVNLFQILLKYVAHELRFSKQHSKDARRLSVSGS